MVGVSARMAPSSPTSPMLTSSQRLRPAQRTRGAPPSPGDTSKLRPRAWDMSNKLHSVAGVTAEWD